jgi:hypothetical protein
MDPLAPNLKYTGTDRTMPYISTLCNIANHFDFAMKFANPFWNDDISCWYGDFPKWLSRSNNGNNVYFSCFL